MQYLTATEAQARLDRGMAVQPGNWTQDIRYKEYSRVIMELTHESGKKFYLRMHPTNSKKSVGKRYNKFVKSAKKGEVVSSEPNSAHMAKRYMSETKKNLEIMRLSHIASKANAGIKILEAK